MHNYANTGWGISVENLKALVPVEYDAFIENLGTNSLEDYANESVKGDTSDIDAAYTKLVEAFETATECDGTRLSLSLNRLDGEEETSDDLEIWSVENVYDITPAGTKFSHLISPQSWVTYG